MSDATRAVVVLVGFVAFLWFAAFWLPAYDQRHPAPCSTYANDRIRDVPVRCLPYFTKENHR